MGGLVVVEEEEDNNMGSSVEEEGIGEGKGGEQSRRGNQCGHPAGAAKVYLKLLGLATSSTSPLPQSRQNDVSY